MLPSRSAPAPFYEKVKQEISEKIASGIWQPHDRIPSEAELVAQYGFSPAALGVPLATLLRLIEPLCRSGKLLAVDMVEFNPRYDDDGRAARVAARLGWQIAHWWH